MFCIFTDLIYAELNTSSIPLTKSNQGTTFFTGPYLDGTGISNVTTQIGTHAYLPCRVSNQFALNYEFNYNSTNQHKIPLITTSIKFE